VPILNKPHPFQRLEAEHTYLPCTSCRQQKKSAASSTYLAHQARRSSWTNSSQKSTSFQSQIYQTAILITTAHNANIGWPQFTASMDGIRQLAGEGTRAAKRFSMKSCLCSFLHEPRSQCSVSAALHTNHFGHLKSSDRVRATFIYDSDVLGCSHHLACVAGAGYFFPTCELATNGPVLFCLGTSSGRSRTQALVCVGACLMKLLHACGLRPSEPS
jgi:hypothetical protein